MWEFTIQFPARTMNSPLNRQEWQENHRGYRCEDQDRAERVQLVARPWIEAWWSSCRGSRLLITMSTTVNKGRQSQHCSNLWPSPNISHVSVTGCCTGCTLLCHRGQQFSLICVFPSSGSKSCDVSRKAPWRGASQRLCFKRRPLP